MSDARIMKDLIRNGVAYTHATGQSMEPMYGDRSTLRLVPIKDPFNVLPGTPVYYDTGRGFNRHLFCGMITLPTIPPEEYAVIAFGDGSFDQLIPPDDMIAVVEVVVNTYVPPAPEPEDIDYILGEITTTHIGGKP